MTVLHIIQHALAILMMAAGAFFMVVGGIGLNRLPDFFTRVHAAGKVDTLGIMLFLGGMVAYEGLTITSGKLILIVAFLLFTSPIASHALARRALQAKLKPWFGPKDSRKSDALDH